MRARLLELAPGGFEEVDGEDGIELAAYVPAGGEAALRAAFPGSSCTPVEPGWEGRWRAFHRPVRAGGLWIGPPWERPPTGEAAAAVLIDPGRAFGTGAHPTTRASIELLASVPRGSLLDAGCGSGVVSIAAHRLGFGPIHAVDADPVALEATRENAGRNGVVLEIRLLDVLREALPATDVVVSNIELVAVEALLARADSSRAVVSGYLARDRVEAPGWRPVDRLELDGWAAESLVRA